MNSKQKLNHIGTRADGSTFVRTTINVPTRYVPFVRRESRRPFPGSCKPMGVTGFFVSLIERAKRHSI